MSYAYDNDEFSHYYDTFVAEHVPRDIFWTDTVEDVYAGIVQRSSIDDQCTTVVELGCGTGENLLYFKKYFKDRHLNLIGIDHSQAMLNRAKEKFSSQSINDIELLQSDLTNFADSLEEKIVDCMLLPAGTFHHLITDHERIQLINNIQRTLRAETGLFAIYLFPDSLIRTEAMDNTNSEDKFKLVAVENIPQDGDNEWICKQTFEFNAPPKIELSWQLRTCSLTKLIQLFIRNNFEVVFVCFDGKNLLSYNENLLFSLMNNSTPVIFVFRTIKNTN